MQPMFTGLVTLLEKPFRPDRGVKIDSSVLLVYPPEKELEFREQLVDTVAPLLAARGIPHRLLDLTGFLFSKLPEDVAATLETEEFRSYAWMLQGLSQRAEAALTAHITSQAAEVRGGTLIVYATMALYPLVRFAEVLCGLRDVESRVVVAFPGEERGGRLHFLNEPEGGNYLAVKLFWR